MNIQEIKTKKWICMLLFGVGFILSSTSQAEERPIQEDYNWWRASRFGIFIHWNASSLLAQGGGSWQRSGRDNSEKAASTNSSQWGQLPEVMKDPAFKDPYYGHDSQVPQVIYDNLFQLFNPKEFDATRWARLFKESGAGYVVFTTKHHDGFCMFDSKYTKYNIMNTPFKRDVCKELADACRKEGIRVIWYYSVPDWYDTRYNPADPEAYQTYMENQIRELCTNYGSISGFWWDGRNSCGVDGKKIYDIIYKNQPGAIYNGRGGLGLPGVSFGSPEQKLGTFNRSNPWESCVTMQGEGWFWNGGKNIMSRESCIQLLVNSSVGDGNLLLDLGPTEHGTICEPIQKNYLAIGAWLKKYGESIYGARGGPFKPGTWGGSTCKGNIVYLHITQVWPNGELKLPALPAKIKKISALTGGTPKIQKGKKGGWIIKLDPKNHAHPDTIIKLELDQNAFDLTPVNSEHTLFVSLNATATASSEKHSWKGLAGSVTLQDFEVNMPETQYFGEEAMPTTKPEKSHKFKPTQEQKKQSPWLCLGRDHIWRFWMAEGTDQTPWLEIDFGKSKEFNRVTILEKFNRIKAYSLQYLDEKTKKWKSFYNAGELGSISLALPSSIQARKVRLVIEKWESDEKADGPGIREFDFWYDYDSDQ